MDPNRRQDTACAYSTHESLVERHSVCYATWTYDVHNALRWPIYEDRLRFHCSPASHRNRRWVNKQNPSATMLSCRILSRSNVNPEVDWNACNNLDYASRNG